MKLFKCTIHLIASATLCGILYRKTLTNQIKKKKLASTNQLSWIRLCFSMVNQTSLQGQVDLLRLGG